MVVLYGKLQENEVSEKYHHWNSKITMLFRNTTLYLYSGLNSWHEEHISIEKENIRCSKEINLFCFAYFQLPHSHWPSKINVSI